MIKWNNRGAQSGPARSKSYDKNQLITILRRAARIWSIAALAFLAFMLLGHLFGPEGVGTFNGIQEILQFLLFPIGMGAGLIIAWKWEGLGGLITIASIIAFHAIRLVMYGQADFGLWIDGLGWRWGLIRCLLVFVPCPGRQSGLI